MPRPERLEPVRTAAVVRGDNPAATRALLGDALHAAGLLDGLFLSNTTLPTIKRGRVVLLVSMSPPAAVDPILVGDLVDLLCDAGWTQVAVASALSVRDRDRGYPDVIALARAAGLLGRTAMGRRYEVIDLHDDLIPAPVTEASVLWTHPVSERWSAAALRIVLARNVTDLLDGYALCLDALTAVAPPIAGVGRADVAAELHVILPAHIAVVDALVSSDGLAGSVRPRPRETATLVVSGDVLLTDVVTAALQGVDPTTSRLTAAALHRTGLPQLDGVVGELTPFDGWLASPALVRDAVRQAGPTAERMVNAALGAPIETAGGDVVLGALRRLLSTAVERADDPTVKLMLEAALSSAGYLVAGSDELMRAWATVFAKDRVARVEVPLGFDLGDCTEADYRGIADYFAPLERLLDDLPPTESGMRWRYLDSSVLFEVSRVLEAPYREFIERVDVAQGISLMADYLGGRVVAVGWDDLGRPIMQAERNIYLAQPNYLAFWGGKPIDVCKIESIEYAGASQRLLWRTIASPNGSAAFDDGSLTFAAEGAERTRVTVRGRQLFTLPPFWQAVDLDRFPEIKNPLVEDAYRRFFTATFDNLEACYEGRDFRIGRDPDDPAAALPTAVMSALLEMARRWLDEKPLADRLLRLQHRAGTDLRLVPDHIDADGFRHFSGNDGSPRPASRTGRYVTAWQQFAEQYAAALTADWSRSMRL